MSNLYPDYRSEARVAEWSMTRCSRSKPGGIDESLLSLSGPEYKGSDGARVILKGFLEEHKKLALARTLLGLDGIITLINGLPEIKAQYAFAGYRGDDQWGLKSISLSRCGVTDEGMAVVMEYAARTVELRRLGLSDEGIELREHLQPVLTLINSSHLTDLCLSNNKLLASSVANFFAGLNSPTLLRLDLSDCQLGREAAKVIGEYLCSSSCKQLISLSLRCNNFGYHATKHILDAGELANFTLQELRLDRHGHGQTDPQISAEWQRMFSLATRNRDLSKRVTDAAIRCLPYARILLNADIDPAPTLTTSAGPPLASFRLVDLPIEILHVIVRHTSGDGGALSNVQFAQLRKVAEGKEGIIKAIRARQAAMTDWRSKSQQRAEDEKLVYAWADAGGWTRWDQDVYRVPAAL